MSSLIRLPDWEARLGELIDQRWAAPFQFGAHDCCLWGADAVLALTGEDFGAPFRGQYTTRGGAMRALRQHGAGTIIRTFDAHLPDRPLALLRRGDLCMMGRGRAGMVGVVTGNAALFIFDRLQPRPRTDWVRGWGVG